MTENMGRDTMQIGKRLSDNLMLKTQLETIVKAGMADTTHREMLAELEDKQCRPNESLRDQEPDEECPHRLVIII